MKAILLIRVSTEAQDLTQQTEKVKAEAIKDGYRDNDIITLEDKESAVKLSEAERNGLNQLKWHIEHDSLINCVYAYEVSRISRQPSTLYSIRDFLIEHHVQLIILNPYMRMLKDDGTLSETANLFFGIFSSMAENEGYLRKQRTSRGKTKKRQLGYHVDGRVPFGYTINKNGGYNINQDEAEVLLYIFNAYADGSSLRGLATELQSRGIKSHISHGTLTGELYHILHKDYYCGDKMHPQIIPRELFDRCQAKFSNNKPHKTWGNVALLKDILYDADSNTRMYIARRKGIDTYRTMINTVTVTAHIIETLVCGVATEWYNIISVYKRQEIIDNIQQDIQRNTEIKKQQEKNITDNQCKIDRIEERYIEGKISKQKADELEHKAFNEMQYYRRLLADAEDAIVNLKNALNNNDVNVQTMREKILYVVDRVFFKRLSLLMAEVVIINKLTGEIRTYTIRTRPLEILSMKVQTRPTLSYK